MTSATLDRHASPAQVAPLVESLLVLIVIGWAAAASGALRQSGGEATQATPELRLQIDPAGEYALDGQPISQAGLEVALHRARAQAPDLRLRIAADDRSDYRAFVRALATAQRADIRNIGSEMR